MKWAESASIFIGNWGFILDCSYGGQWGPELAKAGFYVQTACKADQESNFSDDQGSLFVIKLCEEGAIVQNERARKFRAECIRHGFTK